MRHRYLSLHLFMIYRRLGNFTFILDTDSLLEKHIDPCLLFRPDSIDINLFKLHAKLFEHVLKPLVLFECLSLSINLFGALKKVNECFQLGNFFLVLNLPLHHDLLSLELLLVFLMTDTKKSVQPGFFYQKCLLQFVEKRVSPEKDESQVNRKNHCEQDIYTDFVEIN
jgi:hypothetical protein